LRRRVAEGLGRQGDTTSGAHEAPGGGRPAVDPWNWQKIAGFHQGK